MTTAATAKTVIKAAQHHAYLYNDRDSISTLFCILDPLMQRFLATTDANIDYLESDLIAVLLDGKVALVFEIRLHNLSNIQARFQEEMGPYPGRCYG